MYVPKTSSKVQDIKTPRDMPRGIAAVPSKRASEYTMMRISFRVAPIEDKSPISFALSETDIEKALYIKDTAPTAMMRSKAKAMPIIRLLIFSFCETPR